MRLLIVEDYQPLCDSLAQGLRTAGYAVDVATDGEEGWWYLDGTPYDAVVMDRMLPKIDGLSLVKRLRATGATTPVLLLTARDSVEDRVDGLDAGADDYVTKPFAVPELLAHLRSLVRRGHGRAHSVLTLGDCTIDPAAKTVTRAGAVLKLSPREFQLLEYLFERTGQVISRQELWDHLYDFNSDTISNVLDVLVGRLRKKMRVSDGGDLIHTRRGQGYVAAVEP